MRALAKTTLVELKLFLREPLTVVITLALPLVFLVVLGSVFGNTPERDVFRGVGPTDYYVPAYLALVTSSIGIVALPTHLAGYRERGVLRRFRASSVPLWSLLGALVVLAVIVAVAGSVLLVAVAAPMYGTRLPDAVPQVMVALILGALAFAAVGIMLGSVLPTARAAQGAGVLLWFVMLILGGAGPPPEVLSDPMRLAAKATPLPHVITLIQDPWLGFGWSVVSTAVVLAFLGGSALVAWRFLRWD
jgi:ABC-2 type transport system permease protein